MSEEYQKLDVTVDNEASAEINSGNDLVSSMIVPGCSSGYAVYEWDGSGKMFRVGSGPCASAASGNPPASAHASLPVGSAFRHDFQNMKTLHPVLKELRFTVCCPTASNIFL